MGPQPPGPWQARRSRPRRALAARTAGTSRHRGPSARSRTVGRSPGSKVSSRSPSTAMTPARASIGYTDPGRIRSIPLTPTGTTSPGAMGARTPRSAWGLIRAVTPCGSCRATGDSWPRMLDRPIASGSANAQKSWVSVAGSHTARLPTWRSVDTATSMSAVSARSPTRTSSSLARAVAPSRPGPCRWRLNPPRGRRWSPPGPLGTCCWCPSTAPASARHRPPTR